MPKLLTQKAYAERISVSKQYIHKLARSGKLPLEKGKINPATADGILEALREPGRPEQRDIQGTPQQTSLTPRTLQPSDLSTLLLKTKIKSESEKAKLLEIKAKVEAGKVLDRSEAIAQIFATFRPIRDALLGIPDRLDAELVAMTDRHAVHERLTDEITRVLSDADKLTLKPKK